MPNVWSENPSNFTALGQSIFFKGVVRGKISSEPKGKYGFHYDPIFIPEGNEKTFGEMSIAVSYTHLRAHET